MPTDADIEPRTVATGALAVRRSNHLASRSHPQVNKSAKKIGFPSQSVCFSQLITTVLMMIFGRFLTPCGLEQHMDKCRILEHEVFDLGSATAFS